MKVLIELDDDVCKDIRESDFDSARNIVRNFQATITDAIRSGTPIPDNATNGDMIKAMFPYIKIYEHEKTDISDAHIQIDIWDFTNYVSKDWWDAPYKGEYIWQI